MNSCLRPPRNGWAYLRLDEPVDGLSCADGSACLCASEFLVVRRRNAFRAHLAKFSCLSEEDLHLSKAATDGYRNPGEYREVARRMAFLSISCQYVNGILHFCLLCALGTRRFCRAQWVLAPLRPRVPFVLARSSAHYYDESRGLSAAQVFFRTAGRKMV